MLSSPPKLQLTIRHGSILDFCYDPNPQRSAMVNSTNEACLGGGGLDAIINKAGGPQLQQDRKALPVLRNQVRCPNGEARSTGPGNYGSLKVPYVIHTVGADYRKVSHPQQGDHIVQSAYRSSLEVAEHFLQLEAIAFPLLSSGAFRGSRELKEVIKIGLETMRSFPTRNLRHIYVYAYTAEEFAVLQSLGEELALSTEISYSLPSTTLEPYDDEHMSPYHAAQQMAPFASPAPTAPMSSANTATAAAVAEDLSHLNILPPSPAGGSTAAVRKSYAPSAPSAPPATAPSAAPLAVAVPVSAPFVPPPATAPSVAAVAAPPLPPATATGYNAAVYVQNGDSSPSPLSGSDIAQLKIVEGNFHALIRHETQKLNVNNPTTTSSSTESQLQLPNLVDLAKRDDAPTKGQYYPIQGMNGGYDTQLVYDARTRDWTVTCTTWILGDQGPRPKHSITKDGIQSIF